MCGIQESAGSGSEKQDYDGRFDDGAAVEPGVESESHFS
jgi:hypothetical protein